MDGLWESLLPVRIIPSRKLNNILLQGNTMKKMKLKNEPIRYSEKALKYFQEMNDKDEFMTEPVGNGYLDYLLGDLNNTYDGMDMDTSFDELDSESDWFMD